MKKICAFVYVMFSAAVGLAQEVSIPEIRQRLESFYAGQDLAKIHLAMNKPRYVPGDTIFFKATAAPVSKNSPKSQTSLLNVHFLAPSGEVVGSAKFRLNDGHGFNQIPLPQELKAGKYLLIAFREGENQSPWKYARQLVTISGEKEFKQKQAPEITLYPESDGLVAGIPNRIFVLGPAGASIEISDKAGVTVEKLTLNAAGMGHFMLTPQNGQTYTAVSGESKTILNEPKVEGITLRAEWLNNNSMLRATVARTSETLFNRLRWIITNQESVSAADYVKFVNQEAVINISAINLTSGINRLSILNETGDALAERIFYVAQPDGPRARIELSDKELTVRDKVQLKVAVGDVNALGRPSTMSVSVYNKTLQDGQAQTITSLMNLWGEFPSSYGSFRLGYHPTDSLWLKDVHTFLATQSYLRAPWKAIMRGQTPTFRPTRVHIAGEIISAETGELIRDSTFVTFYLQKSVMMDQAYIHNGRFSISLYADFFGDDEIFYRIERRGKVIPEARLRLQQDPTFKFTWPEIELSNTNDPYFHFSRQQKVIDDSYGFFRKREDYKTVTNPNALIEEEILGADLIINFDDYLLFPTMEETLREIIPAVQHRRTKNGNSIRVYFKDINLMARENPVYIIDGVMTDDTDYFLSLKPSDVVSVKVVQFRTKRRYFGSIGNGGVILVQTKIPDNAAQVTRSKTSFSVRGLTPAIEPKAISAVGERIPDLRTSLLWLPEVKTSDSGEFTTEVIASDATGEYVVRVEGITSNGEPFFAEETFTVRYKAN